MSNITFISAQHLTSLKTNNKKEIIQISFQISAIIFILKDVSISDRLFLSDKQIYSKNWSQQRQHSISHHVAIFLITT